MIDVSNDEYFARMAVVEAAGNIQDIATSPHVLMRPAVYPDGSMWCALYGEDLQMGVAGFEGTPAAACADFDVNWRSQKLRLRP